MTRRDRAWRGAGLALCVAAATLGTLGHVVPRLSDWAVSFGCLALLLSLIGIGLLVQGERMAAPPPPAKDASTGATLPRRAMRVIDRQRP